MLKRFVVSGPSMEPTLPSGSHIVALRSGAIGRGRVAAFPHPGRPDFFLVKRVVGTPGDRVTIANGSVVVNDEELTEAWHTDGTHDWTVGDHEMIVLGDNRSLSDSDSRSLGPVPMAKAYRVLATYRPRLTWVR